jgi:hypothetical protein
MHFIGRFLFEELRNLLDGFNEVGLDVFLDKLEVEFVERLHGEGHCSSRHFKFIINKEA